MRQNTLLVALSAVAVAAAQNSSSTFTINPSEVKPSDRSMDCESPALLAAASGRLD